MSIQSDLQAVTSEIITARTALAEAEKARVMQRHELTQAEARLSAARVALMARSDAGTNDTARRAYAERELAGDRDEIERLGYSLAYAEIAVIDAATDLRCAEDHRRYLETVVQLTTSHATELAIHASYADKGDGVGVVPSL
mgnify:CR=1 FL=1